MTRERRAELLPVLGAEPRFEHPSLESLDGKGSSPRARDDQDVREGGRWSPMQRAKNNALLVATVATLAVARYLPSRALVATGRLLGALVWSLAPNLRRVALDNVERALPSLSSNERHALVRRVYRELGGLLGETVASLDPRREIEPLPFLPGSRECLDDALSEGRGVVFASAHLGPWEHVAASLVLAGVPLTVVAREPYDPRLRHVYEQLRNARGVRTVYRGASGAGVALVRVLRRGHMLGIPMDFASRVASIEVPFLGNRAPTAVGPARLALRTGAALVVGTVARTPDGKLGLSFVRIDASSGSSEEEITERINDELSRRIRAMPESWPWMHRRFSKGQRGAASR